jgi:hypothetical protein
MTFIAQLHRGGEIQTRGSTADTNDLHVALLHCSNVSDL